MKIALLKINIFLMRNLIILSLSCLILFSCKKENIQQVSKTMDNIVVANDFNWESTRTLNVTVVSDFSTIVKVESADEETVYHKGYFDANSAPYEFELEISSSETEILINSKIVSIPEYSNDLQIDLNANYTLKSNSNQAIENLVSVWHFDEAAGSIANDSENTNNGNIENAIWVEGMNNSALSFDGLNSNIAISNASNLKLTNTITLMAWVKTQENKTAKIAQKGDWDGYGLGIDKWNGWFGHITLQDGNKVSLKWEEGTPLLDEWYNLVMTYDGQTLKFYVNGQLKNSEQVEGLLKVNSRNFSIGSDNGGQKFFNGSIDEVYLYGAALTSDDILNYYQQEDTPDTDGDGVPDDDDDYPTDVNRAFDNYYPAKRNGTLMFEDLWPGKGDYDFNDMVLDFRMNRITDAHNKLVEVKLNFLLKAIGAGMPNGFGFQMNNDDLIVEDLNVSGINLVSNYINVNQNNLETGQGRPTIIVFDDANIIMPPPTGFGVNVNLENPYVEPVEFNVLIEFPLNKYKKSKFKIKDFNPFIIVNKERGKEIHLANYPPTDLADLTLFGTYEDDSNVGENRYYKTSNNLPWAILVPRVIEQPLEKQEITTAYLKFYDWASSGGTEFTNWYKNKNGYRNDANIYYPPED